MRNVSIALTALGLGACAIQSEPTTWGERPPNGEPLPAVIQLDTALTVGETTSLAWSCFEGALAAPTDCSVEIVFDESSSYVLPRCDLGVPADLCWNMQADNVLCPAAEHAALDIDVTDWAPGRYHLRAQCVAR